jgi:hypothetical protein
LVKYFNLIWEYQILCIFEVLKTKYKILFSFTFLVLVLFAAVPKACIYALFGHPHSVINTISDGISIGEKEETQDCNFEKFDTPVYYTVFKFILNFLPIKENKQTSFFYYQKSIQNLQNNASLLRDLSIA